jgi:hypothetical protein
LNEHLSKQCKSVSILPATIHVRGTLAASARPSLKQYENNMKKIILILTLQLLCFHWTNGQTLDSILNKTNVPAYINFSIKPDSTFINNFNKNRCAIVRFYHSESSIYYHVFHYNISDSSDFKKGVEKYLMTSNCVYFRNRDRNKNFIDFIKGDYYFLLQLCPCKTVDNPDCEKLAVELNKWLKR